MHRRLFEHARRYSESFSSSEVFIARQRYMGEHPSAIAALKCMDERIHLATTTHTPLGIIQPFRNLGGVFDLGWPHLGEIFPDMHGQTRSDLEPLVFGNMERIAELRKTERALDIEHHEWVICVERRFDFLHMPHLALIVGPYSPNLDDPIDRATGIIDANMRAGRIPDDGFLLLASVPYREVVVDRARAELKSCFLSKFAADVIYAKHPQLAS